MNYQSNSRSKPIHTRVGGDKLNYKAIPQFLIISCFVFSFSGCSGKSSDKTQKSPKPKPPIVKKVDPIKNLPEEEKEIPIYIYSGNRFRDPFTPVGLVTSYLPDAVFDPQRAELKAIIYGGKYRTALLNVGGSGSYFIKKGRIFDIMGKTIDGFRARVFIDRVIITGEAEDAYEIKIRETEEDES